MISSGLGSLGMGLVGGDVVAEVYNATWPLNISEDEGLPGFEPAPIVVPSGGIENCGG